MVYLHHVISWPSLRAISGQFWQQASNCRMNSLVGTFWNHQLSTRLFRQTRNTGSTLPDPFVAWHRNGRQKPGFGASGVISQRMVIQAGIESCLPAMNGRNLGSQGSKVAVFEVFFWDHSSPLKYTKPLGAPHITTHKKNKSGWKNLCGKDPYHLMNFGNAEGYLHLQGLRCKSTGSWQGCPVVNPYISWENDGKWWIFDHIICQWK